MKLPVYFLALAPLALTSCVVTEPAPPVTTTTTVTREVTTSGPTTGPTTNETYVTQEPPAVRVESQTVSPGPNYSWTRGYWRWSGANYVWVPGSWVVRPRPAAVWVEGHWTRRSGGYVWIAGHWR
jgi:WXXGXW repeat (2 copies)